MHYLTLLRQYPQYIGYGLLHYFFSGPGQSFFIALYVPYFLLSLDLLPVLDWVRAWGVPLNGADAAGQAHLAFDLLYSGATLLSGLSLPWVGQWLDRMKLRYFSLGLGAVYAAFCVLMAFSGQAWMLFLAIFGLRLCGQGLMGLTASTATARFFHEGRGQALSLVSFGVSIAEIVLPLLVVALLRGLSWQTSWLLVAASIVLIFVPLVIWLIPVGSPFQLPTGSGPTTGPPQVSLSRGQVLRRPSFYLLTAVYIFVPFFMTGVIINKDLLGAANGWSSDWMALGLSLFGATRLLGNLFSGPLIDYFTATRVFSFMLLPLLLAVLVLVVSAHPAAMIIFFLLSGISASLNGLAATATWAELYGPRHLGAIRSMVSTFMVFGTAVAPILIGWALSRPGQTGTTLLLSAAVILVLTGLAFWQTRRLRRVMI